MHPPTSDSEFSGSLAQCAKTIWKGLTAPSTLVWLSLPPLPPEAITPCGFPALPRSSFPKDAIVGEPLLRWFSLSTESLGLSTTGLERASWTAKFASLLLPPLHWGNVDNERANAKRSGSSSYSTAGRLTMAPRWWKSPLKQRWPS